MPPCTFQPGRGGERCRDAARVTPAMHGRLREGVHLVCYGAPFAATLGRRRPMIATPDLSHLTRRDYLQVYEPAEDTFCLLDALEQDADRLRVAQPRLVVEIG